jgi:hypothetical protein
MGHGLKELFFARIIQDRYGTLEREIPGRGQAEILVFSLPSYRGMPYNDCAEVGKD